MPFRILGPLEAADDDAVIPLRGAKRRALLAIISLNANEIVSADGLMDELRGRALPGVHAYGAAGPGLAAEKGAGPGGRPAARTRPGGPVLRVDREQLDLQRFERLIREAERDEPAVAAAKLRETFTLCRGPPLADLSSESSCSQRSHESTSLASRRPRRESTPSLSSGITPSSSPSWRSSSARFSSTIRRSIRCRIRRWTSSRARCPCRRPTSLF